MFHTSGVGYAFSQKCMVYLHKRCRVYVFTLSLGCVFAQEV